MNSLGAKLVQLTMPGVPDVYQGCELTGLSLVDPDNRRPVDYQRRRRLLAALRGGPERGRPGRGEAAGHLTRAGAAPRPSGLVRRRLRSARVRGPAAEHVVAFVRGEHAVTVVTRLPAGLRRRGGWGDTVLPLPERHWRDVLTGVRHAGLRPPLAELTRRLPVALLIPAGDLRPSRRAGPSGGSTG